MPRDWDRLESINVRYRVAHREAFGALRTACGDAFEKMSRLAERLIRDNERLRGDRTLLNETRLSGGRCVDAELLEFARECAERRGIADASRVIGVSRLALATFLAGSGDFATPRVIEKLRSARSRAVLARNEESP